MDDEDDQADSPVVGADDAHLVPDADHERGSSEDGRRIKKMFGRMTSLRFTVNTSKRAPQQSSLGEQLPDDRRDRDDQLLLGVRHHVEEEQPPDEADAPTRGPVVGHGGRAAKRAARPRSSMMSQGGSYSRPLDQ